MEIETFRIETPDWPADAGPLPRNLRSPHTEAHTLLARLDAWFVKESDLQAGQFTAEVFFHLWEKKADPDACLDLLIENFETQENVLTLMAIAVAALCAQAFRSQNNGEITSAWAYVVEAEMWYGTFLMGAAGGKAWREAISNNARKGANIRHVDTRNIKTDVFKWLDVNRAAFKSKEKTAAAITKQQPIAHRTALGYVGEWEKLQSASTLQSLLARCTASPKTGFSE